MSAMSEQECLSLAGVGAFGHGPDEFEKAMIEFLQRNGFHDVAKAFADSIEGIREQAREDACELELEESVEPYEIALERAQQILEEGRPAEALAHIKKFLNEDGEQ